MKFYERQTERYLKSFPTDAVELLHVGNQQDSEYAIFLIRPRWLKPFIAFSYPSCPIPFDFSYWNQRMTKSGWPAEIRQFPKAKIKQFTERYLSP
ncbi:hypothetical protein VH1807_contig00024-0013 [Vibrio harveyi]|nr:hypothetical protein VH1807_contig00024-0013 [Vibrio harveyi]